MRRLPRTILSLSAVIAVGAPVACQKPGQEPTEPAEARVATVAETSVVSDSLFLGLIFPYAPPQASGPMTQAALLMTRHNAPIEKVLLGSFAGRPVVLDSLTERQFPEGALLGFRASATTANTDVAVLRADDTTLHVLSRTIRTGRDTAEFTLLKEVPIAAGSRLRLVH